MALSDFDFTSEETVESVDLADLPSESFGRDPLPQPKKGYLFRLPIIDENSDGWGEEEDEDGNKYPTFTFDPRSSKRDEDGNDVERVPNGIEVLAGPDPRAIGTFIRWRISARPRTRNVGGRQVTYHNWGYLLRAVLGPVAVKSMVKSLLACSGKEFKGDVDWTARCSPDRTVYGVDPETGELGTLDGVTGCGARYGTRKRRIKSGQSAGEIIQLIGKKPIDADGNDVEPNDDGTYPDDQIAGEIWADRFRCGTEGCPAIINPFLDIRNLQPVNPVPFVKPAPAPAPTPKPAPAPAPAAPKPVAKAAAAPVKKPAQPVRKK